MSNRSIEDPASFNREMVVRLENELATASFEIKDPKVYASVKLCIYHIILKAIAMSKDPDVNIQEVKNLYDLALEIIINSGLDNEADMQNRLQDLINAMIDSNDLSAQFRIYRLSNKEFFESINENIRRQFSVIAEDNSRLKAGLETNTHLLSQMKLARSAPKLLLITFGILIVMMFTIMVSVGIITTLLRDNGGFPMEKQNSSYSRSLDHRVD